LLVGFQFIFVVCMCVCVCVCVCPSYHDWTPGIIPELASGFQLGFIWPDYTDPVGRNCHRSQVGSSVDPLLRLPPPPPPPIPHSSGIPPTSSAPDIPSRAEYSLSVLSDLIENFSHWFFILFEISHSGADYIHPESN